MAEKLGPVAYEEPRSPFLTGAGADMGWQQRRYSDETARAIDVAVQQIVEAAFSRTVALLERQRDVLEHGARLLLEQETLDEADIAKLKAELHPAADAKAAE
jgi:cell division protease FtsH